jgi:hypothetical protein
MIIPDYPWKSEGERSKWRLRLFLRFLAMEAESTRKPAMEAGDGEDGRGTPAKAIAATPREAMDEERTPECVSTKRRWTAGEPRGGETGTHGNATAKSGRTGDEGWGEGCSVPGSNAKLFRTPADALNDAKRRAVDRKEHGKAALQPKWLKRSEREGWREGRAEEVVHKAIRGGKSKDLRRAQRKGMSSSCEETTDDEKGMVILERDANGVVKARAAANTCTRPCIGACSSVESTRNCEVR